MLDAEGSYSSIGKESLRSHSVYYTGNAMYITRRGEYKSCC